MFLELTRNIPKFKCGDTLYYNNNGWLNSCDYTEFMRNCWFNLFSGYGRPLLRENTQYKIGMDHYVVIMIDKLNGLYYIKEPKRENLKILRMDEVHNTYLKVPYVKWEISYVR